MAQSAPVFVADRRRAGSRCVRGRLFGFVDDRAWHDLPQ